MTTAAPEPGPESDPDRRSEVEEHAPRGRVFWTCLVIGAALIGYGLIVTWSDRADTHPQVLAVWVAGAGIAHDAVLAPLIVVAAWLSRRLPDPARTPVRLGLALSALLTVMFWPVVQGWGRSASVPSSLPLDYGRNLLIVLMITWAAVGVAVVIRTIRTIRTIRAKSTTDPTSTTDTTGTMKERQ